MERYQAVFEGGEGEIVEKKSRFIAHVGEASSVEEAQEFIDRIKKKYWDARHNCSAFSVGVENPVTRSSDDGEPGGTAGKPILEVILGSGIRNIVIVVTRYFGGTLLGTGGLIRAYTEAAKAGIAGSVIAEKIPAVRTRAVCDYTSLGKLQYLLAQNGITIEDTVYTDQVEFFLLPEEGRVEETAKKLTEATGGKITLEYGDKVCYAWVEGELLVFDPAE